MFVRHTRNLSELGSPGGSAPRKCSPMGEQSMMTSRKPERATTQSAGKRWLAKSVLSPHILSRDTRASYPQTATQWARGRFVGEVPSRGARAA